MDFRLRQVQCFLTLSECLNFGKASRALYLSQPTLTFQIKSLEEALGAKLFERDRQHVRLTEAGSVFREYAKYILTTAEEARRSLQKLDSQLGLRVGCGPVGQFLILPAIMRTLASDYPDFRLEVCELTTEQQLVALPSGEVDALLMVTSLPIEGMRFDPLCEEDLVAVIPSHSPLARQSSISVHDLRGMKFVAPSLQDCRFHQPFLHTLLAPFGISPQIVVSPFSCSVQFAYVASGQGVAISTASMALCSFPGVVILPFRESLPKVTLGLAAKEANERIALKIFRQTVLKTARKIMRPLVAEPPAYEPAAAFQYEQNHPAVKESTAS